MSGQKQEGSLGYSLGDADDVRMNVIDEMGSDDPARRATARLGRDIISVMEQWLEQEVDRVDTYALMSAAMHGTNCICGTILANMPKHKREKVFGLMRKQMLGIFDAMGKAVMKEQ